MTEKQKHRDTFEIYYGMGDNKSLVKLHQLLSETTPKSLQKVPSLDTLKLWSRNFNWQERVLIRDKEVADKVEKKVVSSNIEKRAKMLSDLVRMETITEGAIRTSFKRNPDGSLQKDQRGSPILNVEVAEIKDLKDLGLLNIKIKQLILTVMGEPERTEESIRISFEDVEGNGDKSA